MTMIFCDEKCIYQSEGCCMLEFPSAVTNCDGIGCIHRVQDDGISRSAQQQHPVLFAHRPVQYPRHREEQFL